MSSPQSSLPRLRSQRARLTAVLMPILAGLWPAPRRTGERGLSQSTENAILLVGAVAVATIVITAVTRYVQSNLPG
ncbi:hypothetical protein C0Z10_00570 [Acidipropionibacterium jensenii]|uniref:Uncharacterized protein n=2 Tax=Acidipropionibacterium jensenii TaxID=1749 RepID=A0A3Q9UJB9_9ACTN|nr:hypothetical protein [Acidipropionibacterium jensenii]AZZ38490.1 hypothetical protein C0Z10_00570 [Acidipropionibacterium jensenii]